MKWIRNLPKVANLVIRRTQKCQFRLSQKYHQNSPSTTNHYKLTHEVKITILPFFPTTYSLRISNVILHLKVFCYFFHPYKILVINIQLSIKQVEFPPSKVVEHKETHQLIFFLHMIIYTDIRKQSVYIRHSFLIIGPLRDSGIRTAMVGILGVLRSLCGEGVVPSLVFQERRGPLRGRAQQEVTRSLECVSLSLFTLQPPAWFCFITHPRHNTLPQAQSNRDSQS